MLEVLGFDPFTDRLHGHLVDAGGGTVDALVGRLGVTAPRLRAGAEELVAAGLAQWTVEDEPRLVVAPPRAAVEALVLAREQALVDVRRQAAALDDRVRSRRTHGDPARLLAVLDGRPAISRAMDRLQEESGEVLIFDRPPYAATGTTNPIEERRLAAGATYRVVYDRSTLDVPARVSDIDRITAAGEQARIGNVPLKMGIGVGVGGILTLAHEADDEVRAAVYVHPSVLLDSLVALFESVWTPATPIRAVGGDDPARRRLLELLAAGLKDDAIARHLAVSVRTVRRRISDLQLEAGVRTRFQLGAAAERLGWW